MNEGNESGQSLRVAEGPPWLRAMRPDLAKEYLRVAAKLDRDDYCGQYALGVPDVLRAHFLIVDHFLTNELEGVGGVGPRDRNLLHSAVSRQLYRLADETSGWIGIPLSQRCSLD
jgi:hypothetical protein